MSGFLGVSDEPNVLVPEGGSVELRGREGGSVELRGSMGLRGRECGVEREHGVEREGGSVGLRGREGVWG